MMYLSHLLIDVGSNPDRPRPGRLWLRNVYHVHQRLSMAFSTPMAPSENARFLFRIDNSVEDDDPRAIILVQSDLLPDWDYALYNARILLAAPAESKEYNPTFRAGEELRFRIRANLSKKSCEHRKAKTDKTDVYGRPKSQGKRVALTWEKDQGPDVAVKEWFTSKARRCGFSLCDFRMLHLGWVVGYRPKAKTRRDQSKDEDSGRQMKFRSALLEGTLTVTDPPAFARAIASGIGSAKAFGFGLLSIAPVRS
jgi:CRISPR system Cascade subunit CasE